MIKKTLLQSCVIYLLLFYTELVIFYIYTYVFIYFIILFYFIFPFLERKKKGY